MRANESVLDEIVASRKERVEQEKRARSLARLESDLREIPPRPRPGFAETLKAPEPTPKIIAEVKRASPSGGTLRELFSPPHINAAYQAARNVVAISVVTEPDYFRGDDETLAYFALNNEHGKPLLRKDFIFDPYQVAQSRWLGADAYLLMASVLEEPELNELVAAGRDYGIEPLVEVHDVAELDMAEASGARCIGANCRDMRDFSLDRSAHGLLLCVDESYVRVAESGIDSAVALGALEDYADAALIGTHFMRAPDIPAAIGALVSPSSAVSR